VAGPVGWQQGDGYGDYDEYYDEEEQQPKRSKWFLAALILLLLILAGLLYLLATNLGGGDDDVPQVELPNVVGKPVDQATAELEALDLEVETASESSEQPANQVIRQDPPATTEVDEGSTVTLTFSSGPEAVAVPDVVGMPADEASRILTEHGFLPNQVPVESNDVEEGLVVAQTPGAGEMLAVNNQVTIEVSSGSGTVPVPDVTNQSEATARSTLQRAGFTNIQSRQEASADVANGNVIRTDPAANAQARPGDPITLIVSTGAERVTVPPVQGLSEQNARSALEGAGLAVQVENQTVQNQNQDGIVITQSPSGNSQVNRGDTVTIFVGDFQGGGGGGGTPTTIDQP
jgi:eukaryotic-like serine/threonine-protein kinase